MSQPIIQTSFNAGEWAPALNARVDLAKYHSGATLLRNFFVDYRGGATARPGLRYVNKSRTFAGFKIRLIPFQASQNISYVLEFGDNYIRFFSLGAPVLEATKAITAITNANPGVVTSNAHGFNNNDWVYITGATGLTALNGNYFIVQNVTANTFTLQYLDGTAVDTTALGAYTGNGTAQRVYQINTTYTLGELFQLKFTQNVNTLIICHQNHPPAQLVLGNSPTSWTLSNITIGSTLNAPAITSTTTTLAAGSVNYAYVVTAVDANGQESGPSNYATLGAFQDIRNTSGTITINWSAVAGAVSYNVYRAQPSYSAAVPAGASFGFVGNLTGTSFIDSNIAPNYALGPPIVQNPFSGSGVQSVTMVSNGSGSYAGSTSIQCPYVTFSGGGGNGAGAVATMVCYQPTVNNGGRGYNVGDTVTLSNSITIQVTTTAGGVITNAVVTNGGSFTSGQLAPGNGTAQSSTSGGGVGAVFDLGYLISKVGVTSPGTGYTSAPAVVFSYGTASATAVIGGASAGNPAVPAIFQQRLVLAGPSGSPQQFNMSTTGQLYNFNINSPIEASDAIQGTISSTQLANIHAMIPQPYGLIVFADKGAWLLNGGSAGSAVTPTSIVANSQIYNGSAGPPPIVAGDNILYVQSKNSIVRNLVFNYYTQIYTGEDISILSSHLFYSYQILDWAYAEEPYKLIWAVRNDGTLLSLTFLRAQELIAWAHHDTSGSFLSIASVVEQTAIGYVDAVYVAVQRVINGTAVIYIERFVELNFPQGRISSKQVDASISYSGAAASTFSGARHLAGNTVTGVADGVIIPPFVMPANGTFTLGTPASNVTVGLAFTPQLQTLSLDLGEPTVQGKRKKIGAVTVRVKDTLGLQLGRTFATAVNMKDLVVNNVGTMSNQVVTDLVTGDARTIIDPLWDVPGQYAIQQPLPYPATILGVIPEIEVGDTTK